MSEEIKQKAREEINKFKSGDFCGCYEGDTEDCLPVGKEKLKNLFEDLISQALQKQREEIIEKIIKIPVHLKNYDGYVVTTVGREELLKTLNTK